MHVILTDIGIALRIIGATLAWSFVFRYARVNWLHTPVGRFLMGFGVITAVFMTLASVVTVFGTFPWVPYVSLLLYGFLVYLLIRQNLLLSREQGHHDDVREDTPVD